jgi:type II secretory pathway pseudopilin PulG
MSVGNLRGRHDFSVTKRRSQPAADVGGHRRLHLRSHSPSGEKPRDESGLTVLELLVALVLTAVLSIVAYASLSLSLRAAGRTQAEAETSQELRVAQAILERSLASMVARVQAMRGVRAYFLGSAQDVRFLTATPLEAHSPGGIYHLRFFSGKDKDGVPCLVAEQSASVVWNRDPEEVEVRQIILRGVKFLSYSYGSGGKAADSWDGGKKGSLPDWVQVNLTVEGRQPQVWLIPIHVAETQEQR